MQQDDPTTEITAEGAATGTAEILGDQEPQAAADPREEFISELKREIVEKRLKAKRVDDANARLVAAYAASDGRLQSADLLVLSDQMLDESGLVDPQKVTAAITDLIQSSPWAARRVPVAPLPGQGITAEPPAQPRGIFDLMRGA